MSDNYMDIKSSSSNGWCNSGSQQKNHLGSSHEAFLSMLTIILWHSKLVFSSLGQGILIVTSFNYLCTNKLRNVNKQIILHNWEGVC